jgi:hypothetical protein
LLFSSGLRLREGGCLLTLEVPEAVAGHRYYEGSMAGAVAKRHDSGEYARPAAGQGVPRAAARQAAGVTQIDNGNGFHYYRVRGSPVMVISFIPARAGCRQLRPGRGADGQEGSR